MRWSFLALLIPAILQEYVQVPEASLKPFYCITSKVSMFPCFCHIRKVWKHIIYTSLFKKLHVYLDKMNITICRSIIVAWFWCLGSRFVLRTQNSDLSDNGLFSNKHHLVLNIKVHYTVTNPQTAVLHCARASRPLLTTSTRTVIFPTVQTKTLFQ